MEMETITKVLFDGRQTESLIANSVQLQIIIEPDQGVMNIIPWGVESGWVSVNLEGGKLFFSVFESANDGNPKYVFELNSENKFVPSA